MTVAVPEREEDEAPIAGLPTAAPTGPSAAPTTRHTEIQYYLLQLGADMGLDLWVARNDRSRQWNSKTFGGMPRMLDELPRQFDPATTRTIELIDVLWLKGNSIVPRSRSSQRRPSTPVCSA